MLYTVTTTLPPVHGGRTNSLLNRIKMIDNYLNIPTKIITTNYNANYPDVYNLFLEQNKVTHNIQFENIYDWLSDFNLYTKPKSKFLKKEKIVETPYKINGFKHKVSKNNTVVRYYDEDNYVLYRRYYENTYVVQFEDFMSPVSKKRIERWSYNIYGILHKKTYYSAIANKKTSEDFLDFDGNIYCKKFFNEDDTNSLLQIQIYKNNRPYKTFISELDLFQFYYEQIFSDNDTVFCDARLLDKPLLKSKVNTNNILVFHTSHLNNDTLKPSFKYSLQNHENVSQFIVLTNKQKSDIQNIESIPDKKFSVIPHFIQTSQKDEIIDKLDRFLFIGRIAPEKQIDHIIKAYKIYLEKGYKNKLDIIGRDEKGEQKRLQNIIKDLNLQNHVNIYDYTNNPLNEFKKSKASFLTSEFEGFGLTIMESIEMGCPVISYDIRYGPSEIISHGENGYLIEPNNIEMLAEYMMYISDEPLSNVKTKKELTLESAIKNYKKLLMLFK
ncbi:glycosyltransferase [Staphylococcus gallinarum]|uniref:glycosyltransferase n=1 Tax=Staphylococcus gallinarum TaxID=1293 RepID=UPI00227E839E|nr:glycosyltransferase [Staphylococcus gallinarum]MDN6413707.1 glycosyltransferase [Staphylococcus gallinarum]